MPDLVIVGALLTSIKTAADIAKGLRDADLSLATAELKLRLADLMVALADARIAVTAVQEEVQERERQILELREALEVRAAMKYGNPRLDGR